MQYKCPMVHLFERIEKLKSPRSPFWEHLRKAKIELLEAFKSLLEEKISKLKEEGEKLEKIEVE